MSGNAKRLKPALRRTARKAGPTARPIPLAA
jgi:hypothetical protein